MGADIRPFDSVLCRNRRFSVDYRGIDRHPIHRNPLHPADHNLVSLVYAAQDFHEAWDSHTKTHFPSRRRAPIRGLPTSRGGQG